MEPICFGWHFLPESRQLQYGDGRIVEPGKTYTVDCEPVLCERGLHWSERAIDALGFNRGPIVCRVRSVPGHAVIRGDNKVVSAARHVVAMANATDLLWVLSRKWAASVFWQHFKRKDYPDVVAWLDHGDFSRKSAARSAAYSAARSAARSAAYSAAESSMNTELEQALFSLLNITPETM